MIMDPAVGAMHTICFFRFSSTVLFHDAGICWFTLFREITKASSLELAGVVVYNWPFD